MSEQTQDQPDQSWVSHLIELRNRILKVVVVLLVVFVGFSIFANNIYTFFATPLMQALPEGSSMISTDPHGPFFVPFKLAFFAALMVTLPFLFYQVWGFIAPGLYAHEKKLVYPLVASSTFLFYCGVLFAYFVVFPIIFSFFANSAPDGVSVMTDIGSYMSFAMKLFFAFGVAFEVPIATIIFAKAGIVSPAKMAEKRAYVIVGAFVVGMLMTPPDIFSQTLLAIPVWLLFELGLFFARRIAPESDEDAEGQEKLVNGE
ncbi:MAG: twin-arginine translocase subunit TatC [Arenicella sp.]